MYSKNKHKKCSVNQCFCDFCWWRDYSLFKLFINEFVCIEVKNQQSDSGHKTTLNFD